MTRKVLVLAIAVAAAAGCAVRDVTYDRISGEMDKAVEERAKRALLPPLVVEMPRELEVRPLEQRFDLNVSGAPAAQVFMAIVSGTRYSMIVHPDVRDTISVNLKDVTVIEALDTMRDLYGYEYRVQGNRITVLPVTLQTRIFKVNYIQASRSGRADDLGEHLAANLDVPVQLLYLSEIMDFPRIPELHEPLRQAQCLQLIGAALREEGAV